MHSTISLIISLQAIPDTLSERVLPADMVIGFILFGAFASIAIARFTQTEVYRTLVIANGKLGGLQSYVRDTMPLNKFSSYILIFNYILSSTAVLYLAFKNLDGVSAIQLWVVALAPFIILVWNLLSLLIAQWITGETAVFQEPIILKIIGAQLLGILYFICALIWTFRPEQSELFIQIIFWVFVAESIYRISKSMLLVFRRGISWYYIILYFCTLEILPLLIAYVALTGNFKS